MFYSPSDKVQNQTFYVVVLPVLPLQYSSHRVARSVLHRLPVLWESHSLLWEGSHCSVSPSVSWLHLWSFKPMSPCFSECLNLYFFDRPAQVKWQLMIASCYRRSGNYQQALETYKKIHKRFPDNIECKCRLGMWKKSIIHVLFKWFLLTSYCILCPFIHLR